MNYFLKEAITTTSRFCFRHSIARKGERVQPNLSLYYLPSFVECFESVSYFSHKCSSFVGVVVIVWFVSVVIVVVVIVVVVIVLFFWGGVSKKLG